jgi:hypothetical protein
MESIHPPAPRPDNQVALMGFDDRVIGEDDRVSLGFKLMEFFPFLERDVRVDFEGLGCSTDRTSPRRFLQRGQGLRTNGFAVLGKG